MTGKTFELAEKGYFPRRRGASGYQLSAALASAEGYEPEAIADYLDPGNVVGLWVHWQCQLQGRADAGRH